MPDTVQAPDATANDALKEVGAIVKELLSQRDITVKDPFTAQMVTRKVALTDGITVNTEMTSGKEFLVFKFPIPHADTLYENAIAEQAQDVLTKLQPGLTSASRVSYRDDHSVTLVLDLGGKKPEDVVTEILQAKKSVKETAQPAVAPASADAMKPTESVVVAASAADNTASTGGAENTTVVNVAPPVACPPPVVTINNSNTTVTTAAAEAKPEQDTQAAAGQATPVFAKENLKAPILTAAPPAGTAVERAAAQGENVAAGLGAA